MIFFILLDSYNQSISFYSDSILCYINSSPTIFPIVIAAMFRPPSIIHLLRATKKQSSAFLQPNKQGWIGSKPDLKFDPTQATFSRTLPNTGIFALKMRKKTKPKLDLSQIINTSQISSGAKLGGVGGASAPPLFLHRPKSLRLKFTL